MKTNFDTVGLGKPSGFVSKTDCNKSVNERVKIKFKTPLQLDLEAIASSEQIAKQKDAGTTKLLDIKE